MRWTRHLLLGLMLLGLSSALTCVCLGGPIWALPWSVWLMGAELLRRGSVRGGAILLLSSAALVLALRDRDLTLINHLPALQIFPSAVAALAGLIALVLLRHPWRASRRSCAAIWTSHDRCRSVAGAARLSLFESFCDGNQIHEQHFPVRGAEFRIFSDFENHIRQIVCHGF